MTERPSVESVLQNTLTVLMQHTDMSAEEIAGLKLADLHLAGKSPHINFTPAGGKGPRKIELDLETHRVMVGWLVVRPDSVSDQLFVDEVGELSPEQIRDLSGPGSKPDLSSRSESTGDQPVSGKASSGDLPPSPPPGSVPEAGPPPGSAPEMAFPAVPPEIGRSRPVPPPPSTAPEADRLSAGVQSRGPKPDLASEPGGQRQFPDTPKPTASRVPPRPPSARKPRVPPKPVRRRDPDSVPVTTSKRSETPEPTKETEEPLTPPTLETPPAIPVTPNEMSEATANLSKTTDELSESPSDSAVPDKARDNAEESSVTPAVQESPDAPVGSESKTVEPPGEAPDAPEKSPEMLAGLAVRGVAADTPAESSGDAPSLVAKPPKTPPGSFKVAGKSVEPSPVISSPPVPVRSVDEEKGVAGASDTAPVPPAATHQRRLPIVPIAVGAVVLLVLGCVGCVTASSWVAWQNQESLLAGIFGPGASEEPTFTPELVVVTTATNTPLPTPTLPPTSSSTPVPATATPQATNTFTPEPTEAPPPTATAAPTDTVTPEPTSTPEPTDTPPPAETATPTVTPTSGPKYGPPMLTGPEDEAVFSGINEIVLQWEPVGDLDADEQYAVRLVYPLNGQITYGGANVKENRWVVPLQLYGKIDPPENSYEWFVVVERLNEDGSGTAISPESERWHFVWK